MIPFSILLLTQIAYTIFLGYSMPYLTRLDNRLELYNESMALYQLYFLFVLNNPSFDKKWVSIAMFGVTGIMIGSNLIVVT